MKLITRDTDYAVRALGFIVRKKNTVVSVAELVKALKIPRPFLRKILQTLQKKQVLKSFKGQKGGFQLNSDAKNIYLVDLMNIFQGPLKINECIFKKRVCPNKGSCILRYRMDNIEKKVISELEAITLESLL